MSPLNEEETQNTDEDSDEEVFVYPVEPVQFPAETGHGDLGTSSSRPQRPSPAQLESLYAAASSGDLPLMKNIFETALHNGQVQSFALANEASTRTGLTAFHVVSSRGHLEAVKWRKYTPEILRLVLLMKSTVLEECGAIPDLEDKEGEVCIVSIHYASLMTLGADRIT